MKEGESMKKWEYTHKRWNHADNGSIENDIKELGEQGWRLVWVVSAGYHGNEIVAFFEREKVFDPAKEGPFTDNAIEVKGMYHPRRNSKFRGGIA